MRTVYGHKIGRGEKVHLITKDWHGIPITLCGVSGVPVEYRGEIKRPRRVWNVCKNCLIVWDKEKNSENP